jgi:hypothetical protein
MIEVKAFRTFIRIYSLFKSERLSTNNKSAPTKHSNTGVQSTGQYQGVQIEYRRVQSQEPREWEYNRLDWTDRFG